MPNSNENPEKQQQLQKLDQAIQTVHRLRAPGGCPWDQAQTHQSLRQYLIEEAYEVLDVLDQIRSAEDLRDERIRDSLKEELGDLLLQVLLHSEMVNEQGIFNIYDVASSLSEKLIRRHPHVFGEIKVDSAEKAFQNWEKQKNKEKAARADSSVLDGVPRGLPALQRAARVLEKVTKVGFQWKNMKGPMDKIDEELSELKAEIGKLERAKTSGNDAEVEEFRKKAEGELGDLFFTLCNVAYLLKLSPEDSLRGNLSRFESRFKHVEKRLREIGKTPEQSSLEEMDRFWDEAKEIEIWGLTGGIASGKSSVAGIFQILGIPILDADQVTRELSGPGGPAHAAIQKRFGTADRSELRKIVFSDPEAKRDLEAILHPLIQAESDRRIQRLARPGKPVIYEAALLVETGRYKDFSGLIVVEADQEQRKARLISRDRIPVEQAEAMLLSQTKEEERRKVATTVIVNHGTLQDLEDQVRALAKKLGWI